MLTTVNSIDKSNQLKLNLDALVSNLNLVNIIQEPKPIVIENVNSNRFFVQNDGHSSNGFNYIDENRLKMFSFLAERKLKEQEWHSKYFVAENPPLSSATKAKQPANKATSKDLNKNVNQKVVNNKKRIETPENKIPVDWALKVIPLDVKLNEMKAVSKQMMSSIENLENILNEFREKRLKVDCIDEQEEIKQAKIHNEQIKNASRLLYNFQNQLRHLELDLSKPDKMVNENQKIQAISRLLNTQRYMVKSIENLNQTYPYRNDNSNKLYINLFKHLSASCEVFSRILFVLNLDPDGIIRSLNQKMFSCCKIISESCTEENNEANENNNNNNNAKVKKGKDLIVQSKIKVIEKPSKKSLEVKKSIVKKPKEVKKIKLNPVTKEIFNSSLREESIERDEDRPILLKKTVQTARLFPSSRVKSAIPVTSTSRSNLVTNTNQRPNHDMRRPRSYDGERTFTYASPRSPSRSPKRVEFAPQSYRQIGNNSLNDSNYMQYDINAYNKPSRYNIQKENDVEMYELHNKYKNLQNYRNDIQKQQEKKREIEETSFSFNQSFNSNSSPLRSYKPKSIISDYNTVNQLYTKMNQMKDESDLIKRKYEMLKYSNEGIISKKSIPYAECYVKVEEPKVNHQNLMIYPVDDEYSKLKTVQKNDSQALDFQHSRAYHQINKPKNEQIERIFEYKKKFSNYSKRNSYLSNSEINEGKLFERLSEDLFDDYFTGVCREIESLNNDLADNILNAELIK